MADRADLLRRMDAALATPHERVHTRYALGLLREARAALAEDAPCGDESCPVAHDCRLVGCDNKGAPPLFGGTHVQ